MTDLEYDYATCDMFLQMVKDLPDGHVNFEILESVSRTSPVPDEEEVIAFLVEEGLLKKMPDGYQITRRGRIIIHEGGLKARARRTRMAHIWTVVAAVSGVIAAIASIIGILLN